MSCKEKKRFPATTRPRWCLTFKETTHTHTHTNQKKESITQKKKIYLMRVLLVLSRRQPFVSGFYGRVSSCWKCFDLTPGAQVSQQTGHLHTHVGTHPGRIDGCVARLKWIRRMKNNNVVKRISFNSSSSASQRDLAEDGE
jgi:hypothetical protein